MEYIEIGNMTRRRITLRALLALLFAGALHFTAAPVAAQVTEQDSLALLDFYSNIYWPSESPLRTWFQGPVGSFEGVEITGNRVTAIRLQDENLAGWLPSALQNLDALVTLDLSNNDFNGEIRERLGNLLSLKSLDLSNNRFEGELGTDVGQLHGLEALDLSHNRLSGEIPIEILNMAALRRLYLNDNEFSEFPDLVEKAHSIQTLTNRRSRVGMATAVAGRGAFLFLEELDISDNTIGGEVLRTVAQLANLRVLDVSGNQIATAIPSELGGLTELRVLDLHDNLISGTIPPSLWELTNLEILDLGQNDDLDGEIPLEIGNLTHLVRLDLGGVIMREVPVTLGNLTNLTSLNICRVGSRSPRGEIGILSTLTNLEELCVSGMGGHIPDSFGHLTRLRNLNLERTYVYGPIPAGLGDMSSLEELHLHHLLLTGEIPASLGNLTALKILDVSDNQLTGEIPASLGNLVNLTKMYLNENQLTGSIPVEFGNLVNLSRLNLHENDLFGPLPLSMSNLTSLKYFSYWDTLLCFPDDPAILAWMSGLQSSSGPICYGTVTENPELPPAAAHLGPNFPNPFSETTTISYSLPETARIRLLIYNILGKSIEVLEDGVLPPGEHSNVFDASRRSPGVYFYRLIAGEFTSTGRMIVLR